MHSLLGLPLKSQDSAQKLNWLNKTKKKKQNVKPFSSNNTLLFFQGANKPHYYLAAYVRVKVISISGISYQEMSANLNCQFYIDISYRRLTKNQKNEMLSQGIRISFETDESVLLSRDNADVSVYDNESEKRISYVVRKFVQTKILCDSLFWSPFELINCQIGLKINKLKLVCTPETKNQEQIQRQHQMMEQERKAKANYVFYKQQQKSQPHLMNQPKQQYEIVVHFNMMDHAKMQVKVQTSMDSNFGLFQIASSKLNAAYSTTFNKVNTEEKKEPSKNIFKKLFKKGTDTKKVASEAAAAAEFLPLIKRQYGKQKLEEFCVALFEIPLYKKPVVANLTIFLPLLVLAIINLGIFYEQPDLHKRIVSIGAIMVSFVALIPTIRQQIPPTPIITLVEILVFSEAITTILALFDSLRVIDADPNTWDFDGTKSILFLLSLIITILVNLMVGILSTLFICSWRPSYIDEKALELQQFKQDYRLNIYEWSNKQADIYYNHFYLTDSLQVLEDAQEKRVIIVQNIFNIAKQSEQEKYDNQRFMMERSDSSEIMTRMK